MRTATEFFAPLPLNPKIEVGRWPTPIAHVPLRGRPSILVKRDDLSGWGRGGAKARKIRYLIAHMEQHACSDLVTVAGNITNLAFDLIPALDRAGLGAHLHIIDDPPLAAEARGRIFSAVAGRVTLLGASRRKAFYATVACWQRLRCRGRRPLWLLPGVSHPAGILGNAAGFLEMVEQLEQQGQPCPSTVFVTAATGTTIAGFLLAERWLRSRGHRPIRLVGAQIYPGRVRMRTRWMSRWAARFSRQEVTAGPPVEIVADALCGGFGRFTPELVALCERVEAEAGLSLDPIFGGKTWSVMERHLDREKPRDGDVLYWHCGYTPEWRVLGRMVRERART